MATPNSSAPILDLSRPDSTEIKKRIGMSMDNSWVRPKDIVLALRCTTTKFAHNLVECGQIKFSTPKFWEGFAI